MSYENMLCARLRLEPVTKTADHTKAALEQPNLGGSKRLAGAAALLTHLRRIKVGFIRKEQLRKRPKKVLRERAKQS